MEFVTVAEWPKDPGPDYRIDLESGRVLYFPQTPFVIPEEDQQFLRGLDFEGGAIHKNIAYRPASDRLTGIGSTTQSEHVKEIMRRYSQAVAAFTAQLLPAYAAQWKLDYASFRPIEEENRNLPLNKRNDLIHTDAFPSRPTNGDLILRVFTNIHPAKTRNWVITGPFASIAGKYAPNAGLNEIAQSSGSMSGRFLHFSTRALHGLGLPVVPRSGYDRFMLRFHEYLKRNTDFQANCPRYRFDFPPASTWMTFTDLTPHSVHSGQHALEQTFIVARNSLASPACAPVAILEKLCGRALLPQTR